MNDSTLKTMFSSDKEDWETPQSLFDELNKEFNFNLDAAAFPHNAKCSDYLTQEQNALIHPWMGTIWLNPPYGKPMPDFIEKAYNESLNGSTVVCLIPARTDTRYWHDYVMNAEEVRLVKGRLKFGDAINAAPFPSAIVVFSGQQNNHDVKFTSYDPKIPNQNDKRLEPAIYIERIK